MDKSTRSRVDARLTRLFPKGCVRVLLINPPVIPEEEFDPSVARLKRYPVFPPYGLGIINRELKKRGYATSLVDLNHAVFANGCEYSAWKETLRQRVERFAPQVCAISCMYSMTHPSLKAVAAACKEVNGAVPVVAGGVHPTASPEVVLKDCREIDFVMLVEGENTFADLLDRVNGRRSPGVLRQVATLVGDEYVVLDDRRVETEIDEPPDFEDLPIGDYHALGKIGAYHNILPDDANVSTMLSNRGCRGSCVFCSVKAFYGGSRVRMRSVPAVVDEMARLKDRHGITHFMWLDDDLLFDEKRALRLFREISERRLGITWDASNGVVASSITPAIVEAALDSGCIGLTIGIESGNPEILRSIRKPSGIHHYRLAAEVLRSHPGIFTKGFLMLGFRDETVGRIRDTIDLARELALDWYPIQILTPIPATGVRRQLEEEGLMAPEGINSRFFLGTTGGQRRREVDEKVLAREFTDPFLGDPGRIPTPEELKDLWFVMDYRVNYEKILSEERPVKLAMLRRMLRDICERVPENPLATLFLGIVEEKLGNAEAAREEKQRAAGYLCASDFWRRRFVILNLHRLMWRHENG
ncbi:MAG: B12-binding domain-containing radical SAM protein [Deltaproteobacteria bacterium]|nr:B12-binding domain-containing radical SAM protein [Deltaproteobacteria bacterium]MDA8179217.1 radical SAM protein [Deltaproteobacteria bacterium]